MCCKPIISRMMKSISTRLPFINNDPYAGRKPEVSKVIRKYNARIVEVNAVFAIVEKNGMSEEITNLYEELRQLDCVLQFVRSGRVAITTSCFERVNEYLADREAKYRQSKHQES